ncbi:MAG: host attachment protein [Gammaproteobacteria bacterium]|nr:host attachment protein [Gammaproteobacteria bacterium]
MATTWIMVANGSEASVFRATADEITTIDAFTHPESRQKGETLASDRSGHFQSNPKGTGSGAFTEPNDPKEFEINRFSQELAEYLDKGRTENQYDSLVLVAPPRFYGLLNQHMNSHVKERIHSHVDKDYTKVPEKELLAQLKGQLPTH